MEGFVFSVFKVPLGTMGVVGSRYGIHMVILPQKTAADVKQILEEHYAVPLKRDEKAFELFRKKVGRFFEGKPVCFREKIDLRGSTPFELKVWDVILSIPRGEVRSYHWVAGKVGNTKRARAVGQALKHNRLPLIFPCHRVVEKDGGLGGFGGGVALKRALLKLEGRIW